MNLLNAIWLHTVNLLCFQHDGAGLPEKPSSLIRVATLGYFFTGCLHLMAQGDTVPAPSYLLLFAAVLVLNLLVRPAACMIIVLASVFSHLVNAVGAVLLPQSEYENLSLALLVWVSAAIVVALVRHSARLNSLDDRRNTRKRW